MAATMGLSKLSQLAVITTTLLLPQRPGNHGDKTK
jgi:hypothetical protein